MDILASDAALDAGVNGYPSVLFQFVLKRYTKLSASEYDAAALAALNLRDLVLGRYAGAAILDRTNVMDVLDQFAVVENAWYAQNAAGVLTLGKLDLQNLDSVVPVDTILEGDIEGTVQCENM